jgi:hypothetical protein
MFPLLLLLLLLFVFTRAYCAVNRAASNFLGISEGADELAAVTLLVVTDETDDEAEDDAEDGGSTFADLPALFALALLLSGDW